MPLHQNRKHSEQEYSASQRLTAEEVRTVIAVWGQQQEMPERPTLADAAEALNIEAGQARKLLEQGRSKTLRRSRSRRIRQWRQASAVAAVLSIAGITAGCEVFAGFASYGHRIYRPIPVAQWGFGTVHQYGATFHRYGFFSVQDDVGSGPNEIHFFYEPGGDSFP